jgi:hypothetical protein
MLKRVFFPAILDEGVDGESLALLTERAFESLVDKVGPRMKLMRLIKMMKTNSLDGDCESTYDGCNSNLFIPSPSQSRSSVWVLRRRQVLRLCQYQVKGKLLP